MKSYFSSSVKYILIAKLQENSDFGTCYTWFFYLAARITKTNFRNWFENFSLIFLNVMKTCLCFTSELCVFYTQPHFYKQMKQHSLPFLLLLAHRPIIRSRFCCKKDDIEENQRKLFKSIPKIRFCDSGCQVKKSSITCAKV